MRCMRVLLALLFCLMLLICPVRAAEDDPHLPYLLGYPDGTVRPEAVLHREELAQILFRFLPEQVRDAPELCWFSDVEPERWSYPAISKTAKLGFLYADTEGAFHPEASVTGQELALVLTRIANTLNGNTYLPELAESWQEAEISFSAGKGWVMGLKNGRFDTDAGLSRAETAAILNRLLDRGVDSIDDLLIGMPIFSDNADTQKWYFFDVQEAAVAHTCRFDAGAEVWTGLG